MTRPSQRWMLRTCASSQAPGYTLKAESEAISLGSETDRAMVAVYEGRDPGVLSPEVAERVERGRLVLAALGDKIAGCVAQRWLDGTMGAGTTDLCGSLLVLDWKSRENDPWDQLCHYGHNLRHTDHGGRLGDKRITLVAAWLAEEGPDHARYEVHTVGDAELDLWESEQRALEARVGTEYNPGEHCSKCHRRNDCAPRRSWASSSAIVLAGRELPAVQLAAAYRQVQQLERYIEQYRSVLREAIAVTGPLPAGDGEELALTETTRREVKTGEAIVLLMSLGWGPDDLAAAAKISITEVKRQARALAPNGKKEAAEDEIMEILKPAVVEKTSMQLRLRKVRET